MNWARTRGSLLPALPQGPRSYPRSCQAYRRRPVSRVCVSCHLHRYGYQTLPGRPLFRAGSGRVPRWVSTEWTVCVERPVLLAIAWVPRPCSYRSNMCRRSPSVVLAGGCPPSGNVPFRVLFRLLSSLRRSLFLPKGHRHHGILIPTTPVSSGGAQLFATLHHSQNYPSSSSSGTSISS